MLRRAFRIANTEAIGARIGSVQDATQADVILKVRRPTGTEVAGYKSGAIVIAIMDPYGNEAALVDMARAGLTSFAMELMPRITRAQVDGRPVVTGQSCRLSGCDRGSRGL